jgi:hypothetical protein
MQAGQSPGRIDTNTNQGQGNFSGSPKYKVIAENGAEPVENSGGNGFSGN